jgi:hypothetical protein
MERVEKGIWTAVMILLVLLEIRTLYIDRNEHDAEESHARCEQIERFGQIATDIERSNQESERQFSATIEGIRDTLNAANTTLLQTQPHAEIAQLDFNFENPPTPSDPFKTGTRYEIRLPFENAGNEMAHVRKRVARFFVDKPDDKAVQMQLAEDFSSYWRTATNASGALDVPPRTQAFWTEYAQVTNEDVTKLSKGEDTLYVLRRIEYSDSTGTWWSDRCAHLQLDKGMIFIRVGHPCMVFENARYRPTNNDKLTSQVKKSR